MWLEEMTIKYMQQRSGMMVKIPAIKQISEGGMKHVALGADSSMQILYL